MFLIRKHDFTLQLLQSVFNLQCNMSIFLNQGLVILNISTFLKFFALLIHLFIHFFKFIWFCCCCCYSINMKRNRSDEGLTLETSAAESLCGGQFTLSTQLIKPNCHLNIELLFLVMRILREFN